MSSLGECASESGAAGVGEENDVVMGGVGGEDVVSGFGRLIANELKRQNICGYRLTMNHFGCKNSRMHQFLPENI
jgi:hypothetical protein